MIGAALDDDQIARTLDRHEVSEVELIGITGGERPALTVRHPNGVVAVLRVPIDVLASRHPSTSERTSLFPHNEESIDG